MGYHGVDRMPSYGSSTSLIPQTTLNKINNIWRRFQLAKSGRTPSPPCLLLAKKAESYIKIASSDTKHKSHSHRTSVLCWITGVSKLILWSHKSGLSPKGFVQRYLYRCVPEYPTLCEDQLGKELSCSDCAPFFYCFIVFYFLKLLIFLKKRGLA